MKFPGNEAVDGGPGAITWSAAADQGVLCRGERRQQQ
jgi:hypothetical protein